MALLYKIVEDALLSGIVATGFGMVFNVPPRVLWMCAVGGALAHALRTLLIGFGLPIEAATLVASTSLGLLGVYWTRRYLIPRLVFSIAALIPPSAIVPRYRTTKPTHTIGIGVRLL